MIDGRRDRPNPAPFLVGGRDGRPAVAVLARTGWPARGASLEAAERLGALLAASGYTVVSSGYGPLVGAVAAGVARVGGHTIGLPVRSWSAEPVPWLTEVRWMPDSYAQCAALGGLPAVLAIGAGPGSLAEAAFAWQIAGRRAHLLMVGRDWRPWLEALWRWLVPRRAELATLAVVDDVAEVVPRLDVLLGGRGSSSSPGRSVGPGR
jgi:predicted Rossmann-fold nucleotide-binding protein